MKTYDFSTGFGNLVSVTVKEDEKFHASYVLNSSEMDDHIALIRQEEPESDIGVYFDD